MRFDDDERVSLHEALGCDPAEADARWTVMTMLADFGAVLAQDFERLAAHTEAQAAQLTLEEQPKWAYLRGKADGYREFAIAIRDMPAECQRVRERMQ